MELNIFSNQRSPLVFIYFRFVSVLLLLSYRPEVDINVADNRSNANTNEYFSLYVDLHCYVILNLSYISNAVFRAGYVTSPYT